MKALLFYTCDGKDYVDLVFKLQMVELNFLTKTRIQYAVFTIITITIGLLSRSYAGQLPSYINLILGDTLYAVMIYWIVRFIRPDLGYGYSVLIALGICFCIELSQLYHADWINQIRETRLGRLVLGRGFLWSDLLAYAFGSATGFVIDRFGS